MGWVADFFIWLYEYIKGYPEDNKSDQVTQGKSSKEWIKTELKD